MLPAAIWGEKTGCFTNVDRTVHLSLKAVEPPGEARSDLDIFLDYARRMDFRDKDGAPLIKWSDAEGAFEAWKECTRGRPCDYTGMTYARLERGPLQWPCNEQYPDGRERLYADGVFPTAADYCETFGHDLVTGGVVRPEHYKANDPRGRAFLKPADYEEPHEEPDDDYPFWLTTGRVVYHFHTRTKTARSKALNDAAPDAFVQIAAEDADRLGIAEGDMVEVASRRGRIRVAARVGDIIPGHAFIPFHYGDWDDPDHPRAANELTITEWDAVSKQPHFKYAAVQPGEGLAGDPRRRPGRRRRRTGSGRPSRPSADAVKSEEAAAAGKMHVANYLGLARRSEEHLAESFRAVAEHHGHEPDVLQMTRLLASWSDGERRGARARWSPGIDESREEEPDAPPPGPLPRPPERRPRARPRPARPLAADQEVNLAYELLAQAARALRDEEMMGVISRAIGDDPAADGLAPDPYQSGRPPGHGRAELTVGRVVPDSSVAPNWPMRHEKTRHFHIFAAAPTPASARDLPGRGRRRHPPLGLERRRMRLPLRCHRSPLFWATE